MNKLLSLLLALALALTACNTGISTVGVRPDVHDAAADGYTPGVYEGTAKGHAGDLHITLTLGENQIEKIEVAPNQESAGVGAVALEKLTAAIIANQSLAVDTVAGATATSSALLEAVTAALVSAGVDTAALQTPVEWSGAEMRTETVQADVIVIGAGGAGMVAALEARAAGKKVVIIEKMATAGGNTARAAGGVNAAGTAAQQAHKVEDSVETFIADTLAAGRDLNDPALVAALAERSADAIDWLGSVGAPLPELAAPDGGLIQRTHLPEGGGPVGGYLVERLVANLGKNDIPVYYGTKATELVLDGGAVVGVRAQKKAISYLFAGEAVIIATGGFAANRSMCTKYRPELGGLGTTNAPGAAGDGIAMAKAVGAQLTDLDRIELYPTMHPETGRMLTESLRGGGAILVNQSGARFVNELERRDVVSAAEMAQAGGHAYLIFDQRLCGRVKAAGDAVAQGMAVQGDTVEALAEAINAPPETLAATLSDWNKAVTAKQDEAFGREIGPALMLSRAPFYAVQVAPGIHHTMGGLKINPNAEVIGASGEPIPGLFAAGEVTGGVHGGGPLDGSAVADAVVFGRQAGQSAAAYCGE